MKINKIELENFKFHQALDFEIVNENCLIYGENGVGKSSIYWALFSVFKKELIDINEFKNRNMDEADEVNVNLTLDTGNIYTLNDESPFVNNNQENIFFTHQDMLEEFLLYSENFYQILDDKMKIFFKNINSFSSSIHQFNTDTNETNHEEQTPLRKAVTYRYELFLNKLLIRVNDIINHHFQENFTISFEYDWGRLDLSRGIYKYIPPQINLLIENESKLKLQFNEAKLKLVSIAIFFALIKLEEHIVEDNSFKLLVLDDFLTSLDMANRKLIVQYILDNFGEYQKIILTHNIQFYNLIIKFLKMKDKNNWDIKNIFINDFQNNEIAKIIDKDTNYLEDAKKYLKEPYYNLEVSGNFIRKGFEQIITQYEQLLELGGVEKLDEIIKALKRLDAIFIDAPSKILSETIPEQIQKINIIFNNNNQPDNQKIRQLKDEIGKITHYIDDKKRNYNTTYLKETIHKTEFYKNILMNYSSHDDREKELYRKEFIQSIEILKKLKKILNDLKS